MLVKVRGRWQYGLLRNMIWFDLHSLSDDCSKTLLYYSLPNPKHVFGSTQRSKSDPSGDSSSPNLLQPKRLLYPANLRVHSNQALFFE